MVPLVRDVLHEHEQMSAPCTTVYYDNSCALCAAEIGHYKRLAGSAEIRFVDASAPSPDLGPGLDTPTALSRFHVRDAQGKLHSGAAGFVQLWSRLPGWRYAARAAQFPGVLSALEGLYRLFLPARPILARSVVRVNRMRSGRPS
jgi:predicted DCC family thiol-disulfide oxidoreductase YuxK